MTNSCSTRVFAEHTATWQRFQARLLKADEPSVYLKQYSHVYHQRLSALKEFFAVPSIRVLELREDVTSTIIGTLVNTTEGTFCEDESGRVAVKFSNEEQHCTGCVLGLTGVVGSDGVFDVHEIHTPATVQLSELPNPTPNHDDPHVMFISGLDCGSPEGSTLPRDMLISYLQGIFTTTAAKISHVICAGGLLADDTTNSTTTTTTTGDIAGVRELDSFLYQVSQHVPITILPGANDPTTANWPQRPIHQALLKQSSQSAVLYRAPNPMSLTLCDKEILATDGTNLNHMPGKTAMDNLVQTLRYRHLCPTGPDSVPTVPHADRDPMVLTKTIPDVYVCGGAEQFATQLVTLQQQQLCRVVCVPRFATTHTAVSVNLKTLGVELVQFQV